MTIRAPQFRTAVHAAAAIVLVAAMTLLVACGASSGPEQATQPPPPASSHKVQLSWNASESPDISGYNIYRAPYTDSCGSFIRINSAVEADTAYSDATVKNGTAYCYATTAVNTNNAESGFSNVVINVEIPAQ